MPNYDYESYCRFCEQTFEKDLLKCPKCQEFLAHSPRRKVNKVFKRY